MSSRSRTSQRAQRFWDRLREWYGTRLQESYGQEPPEDWAALVNDATNETVQRVLSLTRTKHVTHPPTYPEISALFAEAKRPTAPTGPSAMDLLDDHVRKLGISYAQHRGLRWLGKGESVTGVEIPNADGQGSYRVMLQDVNA